MTYKLNASIITPNARNEGRGKMVQATCIRVKGTVHTRTGREDPEGGYRYSSTLSFTSALDGVSGQRHARPLYSRDRPGTYCIGGWVDPKADLDGCVKSRPHREFF